MGCILGTHGPYVHPQASPPDPLSTSWSSPPYPLSTWWRGGTKGEFLVPPLRIAERGTGGEDDSSAEGEVYPQAARLVGPRRARFAVAPHPRSVPRARLRVHAAADASEPRGRVLSAVSRAVPRPRDTGK